MRPPTRGMTPWTKKFCTLYVKLLTVVPEAGEPGEPVVEGDHHTQRVDRIGNHVTGRQEVHDDVEHDRHESKCDRRHGRREKSPVHLREDEGIALCTDIESTVRAVGRIVVWVDAAADDSTISSNKWSRIDANVECPKIAGPRIERTSLV